MSHQRQQLVHAVLMALILLDAALVLWAFCFPDLWFLAFHGSAPGPALAEIFLRRCGANWAGFLLFQLIAWRRWRTEPLWLVVVAGMRWSDIFTDATYVALSANPTWFAWVALPSSGVANLMIGIVLWRSYRIARAKRIAS